jgi:GGDEF domain-containing protein
MKAVLREGDTLARIGGDEFVAVLVDLERPQDCEPVLDRLLRPPPSRSRRAPAAAGVRQHRRHDLPAGRRRMPTC